MDKQKHRDSRRKKDKINHKNKKRTSKPAEPEPSPAKPYLLRNFDRTGVSSDEDEFDDDFFGFDYVKKAALVQPSSSFADLIDQDESTPKPSNDFSYLANTTLTSGYFQFKSEKNWLVDTSKFSDLLAIDVENLSVVFNCIPFNQTVEVDDKYFTEDQLTLFNTAAEEAKKIYEEELRNKELQLKLSDSNNHKLREMSPKLESIDDDVVEEDLEFLLSLKEPVKTSSITSVVAPKYTEEPKVTTAPTKSIDLEKWLDSVLDI
ncbi:uncharacterized protein LOC123262756 [Cotesia glomerata]|nr:uncharacterized protein LOC123262756 [Cotesia glomerata]